MRGHSVLLGVFVATYLFYLFGAVAYGATCGGITLSSTIYDQAPSYRNHSSYPSSYWTCSYYNNPTEGSVGPLANGGAGFPDTDFELPQWAYGQATHNPSATSCPEVAGGLELGLMGNVCNVTNKFQNCASLGANGLPNYIYPGMSPHGSIGSPDSFSKWFTLNNQTVAIPYNICMVAQSQNVYNYTNFFFFPIDGQGWNDQGYDGNGNYHNFGFCLKIHGYFSYTGGETFNFLGDDDVWVYLDKKLVIDLGGPHPALSASVSLDQIAELGGWLQLGYRYDFDMFYCERHTTSSEISLATSIDIQCTYYDWCGACEGNGESCCTAAALAACTEVNSCTTAKCAVLVPPTTSCVYTSVNCGTSNLCYTVGCNNNTGCYTEAVSCNDNNVCTTDSCSNSTGCSNVPITCPGDKCHTPSCNKVTGCYTTPVNCTAPDLCHTATCDNTLGCLITPISCNDNDACTNDTCNPSVGCQHPPIVCDDGDACTQNVCSKTAGCTYPTITCTLGNQCTNNTCDSKLGCQYQNISSMCNDHNACTLDSCDPQGGCVNSPINCQGADACMNYTCNILSGCTSTAIPACGCGSVTCTSSDLCHPITCNPSTGQCTVQNTVNCNDTNPCTDDSCSGGVCSHTPKNCNDNNPCTQDSCSSVNGSCIHTPVGCNDNNACTNDMCDQTTGNCTYTPVSGNCVSCGTAACTWTDACNPMKCAAGECVVDPYNCTDSNMCTINSCKNVNGTATCVSAPLSCDNYNTGSECITPTCDPQMGCVPGTNLCANLNPCLNVYCTGPSTCATQSSNICDDNNICTNDYCNGLSGNSSSSELCSHTNITCTSPGVCYDYVGCDPSASNTSNACMFQPKVCPNVTLIDWCLIPYCDPTIGCTSYNRGCTNPDRDCYTATCNNVTKQCDVNKLPDWTTITSSKKGGQTCFVAYNKAAAAGIITGGILAAIIIGCVVAAVLISIAGRKAYLYLAMKQGGMGPTSNNPLYANSPSGGRNPMFNS